MKNQNFMKRTLILLISMAILIPVSNLNAQGKECESYSDLEKKQDKIEDTYTDIFKIVEKYPGFTYEYIYKDGDLEAVAVKGVDKEEDVKKLEMLILDLKKDQDMIKNVCNRTGVFYSVDKKPKPKEDLNAIYETIRDNLEYPQAAKAKSVEAYVLVEFVVNSQGKISYLSAIETADQYDDKYEKKFTKEAMKAVKKTSGDWKPAEVNGQDVAAFVRLPVGFNIKEEETTAEVML